MKKMLVAMSALALVAQAVSAADVYSSNIVGYQKLDLAGQSAMIASTFMTIGETTWRLGDVKVEGMDPFGDMVQVLSLTTASTAASYTYLDLATATGIFGDANLVGWWDVNDVGGDPGSRRDDVVIAAGQGLLCNIASTGVQFTYAGELLDGGTEVPLLGQSAILSNFLPMDITLGDVEAIGMDPFGDMVQDLSLTTAATTASYTYLDLATATGIFGDANLVGWWDVNDVGGDSGSRRDTVAFPAGKGFLCNIASSGVSFVFPDPTP